MRRYESIEFENGRVLGKAGQCEQGTTKVDSWWRWIFWHCSYCMCVCDEQGPKSDRYFNLRASVSNMTANQVVTGLRFQKVNRIIHIQIQQGQLLPRGQINATTVEWNPISDYKLLDRGIRSGLDYHTMTWDKRAIDLDDLESPRTKDHVVTGIRFRVLGGHLNLEIRITEFNFTSGQLIDPDEKSFWISSDTTESSPGNTRRTPVKLKNPDVPSEIRAASEIDSEPNQYIEFTHTDLDRDAAQSTVPYIDCQEVTSFPPVALSGAGIYHKGTALSGGFLGLRLSTYDYGPHIQQPEISDVDDVKIVPLQ